MGITLYRLEGCPFCELVAEKLDELELEYDSIWVESLHSQRDEVKRVSGQRVVPVIVDDERGITMAESENIVEYLETNYAEQAAEA